MIFDTTRFPARWFCGDWPEWLGWEHIFSDCGIATFYLTVAILICAFGRQIGMHAATVASSTAFFALCGSGHAIEALIFWHPVYFLAGHAKAMQLLSIAAFFACLVKFEAATWRTPQQAREDQAEAQAVFDMSSVATYVVNEAGCLTKINRAMVELTGWNDDQLGKNMHYVLHHHRHDGSVYPLEDCRMFVSMKNRQTIREHHDTIWDRDRNPITCSWVSTPIFMSGRAVRTQIQIFPKREKTLAEHAAELRGQ